MADTTRNIFSLSEYSDDTIAGDGIPVDSVFLTDGAPASAAYVTSGIPGYPSEFQKADMNTDTFTTLPSTAFPGPAGTNRVGMVQVQLRMRFGMLVDGLLQVEGEDLMVLKVVTLKLLLPPIL